LLGGSFNPAHEGHVHISRQALARLGLDAIWWVVSPQNPLKKADGMAPFEDRLVAARKIAGDPRIVVTDIEARLGTRYTIDTMQALLTCFPENRFVWIMGADILAEFPRWKNWRSLFGMVSIAVFDRAPYSMKARAGEAARCFASKRTAARHARKLADRQPPAWTYFSIPLHPATATKLRAAQTCRTNLMTPRSVYRNFKEIQDR